jgi:hypothetical protein
MRKLLAAFLALSLAFGTVILKPRPAHAIVAAVSAGALAPGAVLLAVGLGIGVFGVAPAPLYCSNWNRGCGDTVVVGIIGAGLMIVIGVIMLNEETQHPTFLHLEPVTAQVFGLSEAERAAYNAELEEINTIAQSAAADQALGLPPEQRVGRYEGLISPTATSAMGKILKN